MARYYFDIQNADGLCRDDLGLECGDIRAARDQARYVLPQVSREPLPDGESLHFACDVRDEAGRVVYRTELTFRGVDLGGDGRGNDAVIAGTSP